MQQSGKANVKWSERNQRSNWSEKKNKKRGIIGEHGQTDKSIIKSEFMLTNPPICVACHISEDILI